MEKDDEVKGEGNSLDFGERMLDTRIGRWFKTDKVNKPWLSPYQFADNNPVNNVALGENQTSHDGKGDGPHEDQQRPQSYEGIVLAGDLIDLPQLSKLTWFTVLFCHGSTIPARADARTREC